MRDGCVIHIVALCNFTVSDLNKSKLISFHQLMGFVSVVIRIRGRSRNSSRGWGWGGGVFRVLEKAVCRNFQTDKQQKGS